MSLLVLCLIIAAVSANFWPDPGGSDPVLNHYFSNEVIGLKLKHLQIKYPNKIAVRSLGKTPGGHEMWSCVVTNNVAMWDRESKPGVKYIANMHGNEVRGRSLLLKFATFLCQSYNPDIDNLLNTTVVHIVPTMNPDGFKAAQEGQCTANLGRYTNTGVDLNRDFPDYRHSGNKLKFAEETKLIMDYAAVVDATLSINFHDGSLVVNYPWDASNTVRAGMYSECPDDALFRHLALTYAKHHSVMQRTDAKCDDAQTGFKDGITNGNQWYPVFNGMQDWNYVYQDCFEVTVELGCCKYPLDSVYYNRQTWRQNINSLIAYTNSVHIGISGIVKDYKGKALVGAVITIGNISKTITVKNINGNYWRLLVPGIYDITAVKTGYLPLTYKSVRVYSKKSTTRNFFLMRLNPQPDDQNKANKIKDEKTTEKSPEDRNIANKTKDEKTTKKPPEDPNKANKTKDENTTEKQPEDPNKANKTKDENTAEKQSEDQNKANTTKDENTAEKQSEDQNKANKNEDEKTTETDSKKEVDRKNDEDKTYNSDKEVRVLRLYVFDIIYERADLLD